MALTIALSKLFQAANIPPIMRNPINPDKVPVVTQPNQADKVNPITVTIIGHFWYDKADLVIQASLCLAAASSNSLTALTVNSALSSSSAMAGIS